ncbi:MAG: hypothetical protein WAT20_11680, partial [Ferruginibacter sp.]
MKTIFTNQYLNIKPVITLFAGLLLLLVSVSSSAQLGTYEFTGAGTCPNQDAAVTTQPVNAVFSNYTSVNTQCDDEDNVF